jgi:hypothetical protein
MYFENIGTEKVTIGLRLRMGECTLKSLPETYPSVFLNEHDARNYVNSNRKVVVLIRDAVDRWKSGYYQNFKNEIRKRVQDKFRGNFYSYFLQPLFENSFNTFVDVDSDILDAIGEMHDIEKSDPTILNTDNRVEISWMWEDHATFWQWNNLYPIDQQLYLLVQDNVYFLELKDLSNPKFLEWLRKQDKAWEGVKSINKISSSGDLGGWHKTLHQHEDGIIDSQDMWGCFTPPGFWPSMDLFWKEYKEGEIIQDKALGCPFYELPGNSRWRFFTGGCDLLEKVKKEQKVIDFIRDNHERYISKLL